ncbi:hypothetical protein F4823DRAFT_90160 [Ustulina deusta]|nr:hypothetical protein F4823DRAFT_90160 [Ustulina deusta]
MPWLTRRSPKGKSNRDARGSLPSSPSQSPPPRHDHAAKTLHSPPQAPPQDPRWTLGRAQGGSAQQQAASRTTSSRETGDANDSTHNTSADSRDTGAKAAQDDRKGKGVVKRAAQQGEDAREAGADGQEQSRSIWERKAAKVGGRDGDASFRERTPLPPWLRDP